MIRARPLTADAFAPFGDVIAERPEPDRIINQGLCARHHDLAGMAFLDGGRAGISLFRAQIRALPHKVDLLERHPQGSQAFLPMGPEPFLVIVAPDAGGRPGAPEAYLTAPGTGVNYRAGTWHGVLAPIAGEGLFAVIDRIGPGANLEEHWLTEPVLVTV